MRKKKIIKKRNFTLPFDKINTKCSVMRYYVDGSFDYFDDKRIKPITRLRKNEKEIELENNNNKKLRLNDWMKDISNGYFKNYNLINKRK